VTTGQLILVIFLEIIILGPIVALVGWAVWATRLPDFDSMTDAELYYRAGVISKVEAQRCARPGITGEDRVKLYNRVLKGKR
jgi:hypothetical protein